MIALFLALTAAVALLLWAEIGPSFAARRAKPEAAPAAAPDAVAPLEELVSARNAPEEARAPAPAVADDEAVMARIAAIFADPEPAAPPAPVAAAPEPVEELPRISDFQPGDVIELELEGPAPRAEDIRFEQAGRDTRVLIEGIPALILARAKAASLGPEIFRFRSLPA